MSHLISSMTGYVFEDALRKEANDNGRNYWYSYIAEILDEIGIRSSRLSCRNLLDPELMGRLNYLFIGDIPLTREEKKDLLDWVFKGGTLIGFANKEADDIFGLSYEGRIEQPDDEFTISGYGRFHGESVPGPEYGYHGATLPIFSDLELVVPLEGGKTGSLLNAGGQKTGYDAVVTRALGKGKTVYFAFDLPQTLWVMHQGRPVTRDYDRDGYYRTGDSIPFARHHNLELPFADYWLQVLEDILTETPQPFIHQLPPLTDGTVPDLLLHYGGDDECTPGIQVKASRYMQDKGLPYHMNLMPVKGKFAITREEFQEIRNNGHDLSVHYDFVKPHFHYKEEDVREQFNQYVEAFGEVPVASVNHWLTTTGWTEHARWCSALGMKGDNSRAHSFSPPLNPINMLGFGFGSAYPHFVYDDYSHGNAKIPFVYIPIGFYEPRMYDETREEDLERIHKSLDRAKHFNWTLNVFIHPIYIVGEKERTHCLPAIDEILRYIESKEYKVVHHSTTEICLWWHDRSETSIEVRESVPSDAGGSIRFAVDTKRKEGVLVKLPLPGNGTGLNAVYSVGGERKDCVIKQQNGRSWAICLVPCGTHEVEVCME